jgi:hypothetical protein
MQEKRLANESSCDENKICSVSNRRLFSRAMNKFRPSQAHAAEHYERSEHDKTK